MCSSCGCDEDYDDEPRGCDHDDDDGDCDEYCACSCLACEYGPKDGMLMFPTSTIQPEAKP